MFKLKFNFKKYFFNIIIILKNNNIYPKNIYYLIIIIIYYYYILIYLIYFLNNYINNKYISLKLQNIFFYNSLSIFPLPSLVPPSKFRIPFQI